jgi:stalled ribosome alternative rescue factor ArfA
MPANLKPRKQVKRNPFARALRDQAFRKRVEKDHSKYDRKVVVKDDKDDKEAVT